MQLNCLVYTPLSASQHDNRSVTLFIYVQTAEHISFKQRMTLTTGDTTNFLCVTLYPVWWTPRILQD